MIGILYFSSTGNSLYISQRIQHKLGGKIVYIPTYQGDGGEFEQIIVVTPIYSYGMPCHVFDLLPMLNRQAEITIVQNYGGMVGGADYYVYKYALQSGLNIKGVYTLDFTVPKFYLNSVLRSANKRIDAVIEQIAAGEQSIPCKKRTNEAKYLKNKGNWHIIGERFSVNDKCTNCGKCIGVCPSNNISMVDGKIEFSNRCVACLGCYHRCPNKAIEYRNRKKKDRYINPFVDESLIGKDIE